MIIGIGHDLASLARMEKAVLGTAGARFRERILTGSERELASACSGKRLIEFIGGRFAAKEAVSKAFGCGIGSVLGFQDIAILRASSGKPLCQLTAEAWERLGLEEKETVIHVSITHDFGLASAYVIVERID